MGGFGIDRYINKKPLPFKAVLSTFKNIKLIMFTSFKEAKGMDCVELEIGLRSAMFDKRCNEHCRERRWSPDSTPVRSLSLVMLGQFSPRLP